ncbi:MAG: GntR family transcriptional regulator [Pleomorphochaeta sp.]|jgi:GntR family transcriptional regulator
MKKVGQKKPLYEYVQEEILNLIKEWDNSRPIPSEAKLSKDMGVSRNTVREAIQNLEKADVLIKKHGVGTFINKQSVNVVTALNNLHGIQKIVASEGKTLEFKQNQIDIVLTDSEIASYLKIKNNQKIIKIVQTYLADKSEIIKGICYINPKIYNNDATAFLSKIEGSNDTKTNIFNLIENFTEYTVDHAITKISAVAADEETAESLSIKIGKPIVQLNETYFDANGTILMHSIDLIDSENFELLVVRKRSL